ncbi:MAG: RNA helicase [Candidatus Tokpelaia hoelldobleri]|uniref:RNA helicase n=1 Tax=Candidatus Tokpelaia hoelldobleri TaxID=1902579 RepID=A0A1U9JUX4_9HYPH|nr:MAG: RNA helicase [Candidatus Tokpelaia hoelldoblerii]
MKANQLNTSSETSFQQLGLSELLVKNLAHAGMVAPKPIQEKAIPAMLAGHDLLAIAQTGSGKTLAFALPVLAQIAAMGSKRKPKTARALILAPTRELAVQIETSIRAVASNMHLAIGLILGGVSRHTQIKRMAAGVDVLIATPGRLMDHIREKNVDLSQTQFFVLDEADRMLDMGFIRDVRRIAELLAPKRQTALFSATMPKEIAQLAQSLLRDPVEVETAPQGTTAGDITEKMYPVTMRDKKQVLAGLLALPEFRSVIVFTRTKYGADAVTRHLEKTGYPVAAIHGNKSQNARQRALNGFRDGSVRVLVATDIAARGIDVPGISHVINFELPDEAESYVHRIGRTGRNGASGVAITLYDAALERSRLRGVEKVTRKRLDLQALPELPDVPFVKKPVTHEGAKKSPAAPAKQKRNRNRRPKKSFTHKHGGGRQADMRAQGKPAKKSRSERRKRPAA